MIDNIIKTIKHTIVYAFGNISSKLVGFILLPIYTKEIPVASYGIFGLLELIDMLATHILSIGLPQALLRWYGLAESEIKKRNYIFTIFTFLFFICICSLLLIIPFRNLLSIFLFNNHIYNNFFIYVFLYVSFNILNKIPLIILRMEEKSLFYTICIISQFTINLFLNIYFVAFLKLGVKGILIAQTISAFMIFIVLLFYLLKKMNPFFELNELKEMLLFSYPFIFATIGATILNIGNRYLLKELATFSEVGMYTLGYKFSNVIKIFIVDAFSLGLPVIGWQIVKENSNPKRFFSKSLTYLIFVLLWFALIISAYSKGIIHRFALNQEYWNAYSVIPLLSLSVVFIGIHRVLFFELQIPKKTKTIPIIVCTSAIINILLNLFLIPPFGMMGSAFATLISNILIVFFAYKAVQRFYPIKYEIKRIIILFSVTIGLYLITMLFNNFNFIERILYKGIVILSYPFVLYMIHFFEPVEINRIRSFITNIKIKDRSKLMN